MRRPILLNANNELQDQDGVILAKGVEVEFGKMVVSMVNQEMRKAEDVAEKSVMPMMKISQSERMKEYWRKRREAKASV